MPGVWAARFSHQDPRILGSILFKVLTSHLADALAQGSLESVLSLPWGSHLPWRRY